MHSPQQERNMIRARPLYQTRKATLSPCTGQLYNVLCFFTQGPLAIVRRETSWCNRPQAKGSSGAQIADLLPSDSDRKLEVAQGIINAAFRQKAAEMGGELQRLRAANADKDSRIRVLESRLAECQDSLRDARSQVPAPTSACIYRTVCIWSLHARYPAQPHEFFPTPWCLRLSNAGMLCCCTGSDAPPEVVSV